MGYQEPTTIHIIYDGKDRPILQLPTENLSAYLKEQKKRAAEASTQPSKKEFG